MERLTWRWNSRGELRRERVTFLGGRETEGRRREVFLAGEKE